MLKCDCRRTILEGSRLATSLVFAGQPRQYRCYRSRYDIAGVPPCVGSPSAVFPPADDREEVPDSAAYPYSAICSLEIVNQDGSVSYGTGFLAGPRLLITAGHCVYPLHLAQRGFVSRIHVYPGLKGDRANPPFQTVVANKFRTTQAWVTNGHNEAGKAFDFGAVLLPGDVGGDTGWFTVAALTSHQLMPPLTATIAGYPVQAPRPTIFPPTTTMWRHSGGFAVQDSRLTYLIDATAGQSGAPLFAHVPTVSTGYVAFAIHNWEYPVNNAATRVSSAVFAQIAQWRAESEANG
jgi:glutamyl endopeptidase